jgi:hypothetical protein
MDAISDKFNKLKTLEFTGVSSSFPLCSQTHLNLSTFPAGLNRAFGRGTQLGSHLAHSDLQIGLFLGVSGKHSGDFEDEQGIRGGPQRRRSRADEESDGPLGLVGRGLQVSLDRPVSILALPQGTQISRSSPRESVCIWANLTKSRGDAAI